MRRRFPIVRVVLLSVATVLLGFSVYHFCEFRRLDRQLRAAETARIGQIDADLSRPGQYRIEVTRQFELAHGMILVLDAAPAASGQATTAPALGDLKSQLTLAYSDQSEARKEPLDASRFRRDGDEIYLYERGGGGDHFTYILDIEQGASALAGRPQHLYARYELCGLESLVVTVAAVFSAASGLVGALILFGVVRYTRKHRARPPRDGAEIS